ncbi:unnamed protein product, partial [Symbiodinium necroappetens]
DNFHHSPAHPSHQGCPQHQGHGHRGAHTAGSAEADHVGPRCGSGSRSLLQAAAADLQPLQGQHHR